MPPPTLSPPPLHFLIIDFTTTCGINQFTFVAYTDTYCHLSLHLSLDKPIIRRIPYQKRGADFELSSVTCFVAILAIDQDEAGDTTDHTFTVPLTAYYMPHYWYLTGTHSGTPSKSISQIFNIACPVPSGPIPRCKAENAPHPYHDIYKCYYLSSCFQPTQSFNATSCEITFQNDNTASKVCKDGKFYIWTAASNGRPSVEIYSKSFTNPDLTPGAIVTVEVPITNLPLAAGSQFALAYGFNDYSRWWNMKRSKFLFAYGLTCEYTVPPSRHVWIRRYAGVNRGRCGPLSQNWYAYTYDRNLWFKFHGTDA